MSMSNGRFFSFVFAFFDPLRLFYLPKPWCVVLLLSLGNLISSSALSHTSLIWMSVLGEFFTTSGVTAFPDVDCSSATSPVSPNPLNTFHIRVEAITDPP